MTMMRGMQIRAQEHAWATVRKEAALRRLEAAVEELHQVHKGDGVEAAEGDNAGDKIADKPPASNIAKADEPKTNGTKEWKVGDRQVSCLLLCMRKSFNLNNIC